MRKLIFIGFALLSGCATHTIHDYCIEHSEHYGSYEECYSERNARKERISNAFSHIGDGLKSNDSANCLTAGENGLYSTNCY